MHHGDPPFNGDQLQLFRQIQVLSWSSRDTLCHPFCKNPIEPTTFMRMGHEEKKNNVGLQLLFVDHRCSCHTLSQCHKLRALPLASHFISTHTTFEKQGCKPVYPSHFSKELVSLIKELVVADPSSRLGYHKHMCGHHCL